LEFHRYFEKQVALGLGGHREFLISDFSSQGFY